MPNPLHLLAPPILLALSLPLAIFAAITTSLAFSTLLIRVSIVYFELGVALLHSWLFVDDSPKRAVPPPALSRSSSSGRTSPHQPRSNRRTSTTSTHSAPAQDLTNGTRVYMQPTERSGSFASLVGSGGPSRDYEGVGGWRVSSGDGEDEALWIGMNSRLELPAVGVVSPEIRRRHQRSLTGPGSLRRSWSPEAVRMSPVSNREGRTTPEEYFNVQPQGKREEGKERKERRRKSSGGSSTSSGSSGKASLTSLRRVSAG